MQELEGDEALVVVEGDDGVELAVRRLAEDRVGDQRAGARGVDARGADSRACDLDGRTNQPLFLVPEAAGLARVWVESGDSHAGSRDAEVADECVGGQPDRGGDPFGREQ